MLATGVGQRLTSVFCDEPDSIPLMRCGEVSRSDNTPLRVIPHFGKVTEHDGETSSHKQR
jgi:hypothetical protein